MLGYFQMTAQRQGVERQNIPRWIHRKYGDMEVSRVLSDGKLGISFPCVICRKALEKASVQWRAHIGTQWIRSTDADVPRSHPTNKQVKRLGFNFSKLLP